MGNEDFIVSQHLKQFTHEEQDYVSATLREMPGTLATQLAHRHDAANLLLVEFADAKRAIATKAAPLGAYLGAATAIVQIGSGEGLGFYQTFQNGAIYWRRDLGAFWVHGAIYVKYVALAGEASRLGYPTADESSTSDGVGRFTSFVHGAIYWHPLIGAFEVHGDIYLRWRSLGAEAYGYPTTDETNCDDGIGRYNHFQSVRPDGGRPEASIYWTYDRGALSIIGAIQQRWIALGAEKSYLGYPLTDEKDWFDPETNKPGRLTFFERGAIGWIAETAEIVELPDRVVLNSGHIGVSSVGGWAELILSSAGSFAYRGHLHNSGFVGLHCKVGSIVLIAGIETALAITNEFNVGGTASIFDDRDEDWSSPTGYSPIIREQWEALRTHSGLQTSIRADFGADTFSIFAFLPAIAVGVAIVQLLGGEPPEGQTCKVSGMHTLKDPNNNTIAEPTGVRCTP